jgi:hypothetical protein
MLNRDLINRSKYVSTLLRTQYGVNTYTLRSTQTDTSEQPQADGRSAKHSPLRRDSVAFLPLEIKFCVS